MQIEIYNYEIIKDIELPVGFIWSSGLAKTKKGTILEAGIILNMDEYQNPRKFKLRFINHIGMEDCIRFNEWWISQNSKHFKKTDKFQDGYAVDYRFERESMDELTSEDVAVKII